MNKKKTPKNVKSKNTYRINNKYPVSKKRYPSKVLKRKGIMELTMSNLKNCNQIGCKHENVFTRMGQDESVYCYLIPMPKHLTKSHLKC